MRVSQVSKQKWRVESGPGRITDWSTKEAPLRDIRLLCKELGLGNSNLATEREVLQTRLKKHRLAMASQAQQTGGGDQE